MTFRFLHLADLHLDSAYGGSAATVERLRAATLEALENAVQFAIEAKVDAVVIAGDAFDDDRLGYDSRSVLRREIARLSAEGISVVYVTGNHDPGAATARAATLQLQAAPDSPSAGAVHTHLDGAPQVLHLPSRHGGTGAQVVLAGHATSRVTDNLARGMQELLQREPLRPDVARIGVLHTQVVSASGADGHGPYAPCSVADLMACDLDYWALGHVHVRGRVDAAVPAYYPGNLQGRHAKESGPKGGLLVELDVDGLEGEPEFIPFAPVEFFRCAGIVVANAEPEAVAEQIAAALDEAAALGAGPVARELVIRFDIHGADTSKAFGDDFRSAVREELQLATGAVFGEVLEVQLAAARTGETAVAATAGAAELRDRIEHTPSALRDALHVCREQDTREGTRLEAALMERLLALHPASSAGGGH